MKDDWIPTTIGEQITLQRGFDITRSEQRPGKVPVISSGGISSYHDTSKLPGPGVILGRKGVVGSVYYIESEYWPHDTTLWVKNFHGNDPRFVYYFFRNFAPRLAKLDVGSANPTLNRNHVHPTEILWPALPIQHAIARILGSLDDNIELNRQMNESLEAMARAIFKSWFVDFDPVRAKAEGHDTGLPVGIAALFPDGFEEIDGREVPRGWGVGSIYEIADVIYGAPFSSNLFNTEKRGLPLIRIRDLSTQDPEIFTDEDQPRGEKIKPGDIVVGMDGEFKIHVWTGPISWLNQRVCKFVPKDSNSTLFLKYSILDPVSFFERSKVGTTIIHLGKSDIDTFRILIPSKKILTKFGEIAEPVSQKIIANAIESRTLAHMRDALLPKLMSGEIRVGGIEK